MADWREDYIRYKSIFLKLIDLYRKKDDVKVFLELLLTLSTITIFIVFALKPTIITIIDLTKEIKTKEETVAKMDTKIKNLVRAQANLSQEQERLQLLDYAIPSQPFPTKAIGQFIGLAQEKNVTLETALVGETVLKGRRKKKISSKSKEKDLVESLDNFNLTLNFKAEFQKIMDLLKSVENMRRPIKIDSLSLSKNKSENESNTVNLNISGRIPFLKTDNVIQKKNKK